MTSPLDADVDAAELGRLLERKRKRRGWGTRRRTQSKSSSMASQQDVVVHGDSDNDGPQSDTEIDIQPQPQPPLPDSIQSASNHVYQWVVVMEHQRGFTLFDTPRYSSASLLPNDPSPFQVYDGTRQVPWAISSFDDYTLPSPLWLWISQFWMVDMRGDGEVDANGWQYGQTFNSLVWSPGVKSFSRGGWVRRRRWVRLMMKPAQILDRSEEEKPVTTQPTPEEPGNVWKGDEGDWDRCRRAVKARPTDGQKLELWTHWLKDDQASTTAQRHLATHLDEILRVLIYPETRAQMLLLRDAKILSKETGELPAPEFWSYRETLNRFPECGTGGGT